MVSYLLIPYAHNMIIVKTQSPILKLVSTCRLLTAMSQSYLNIRDSSYLASVESIERELQKQEAIFPSKTFRFKYILL